MKIYGQEHEVNHKATQKDIVSRLKRLRGDGYDYSSVCHEILDLLLDCFGYAAHVQGITGFQASMIDMAFLAASRGSEHLALQDLEQLLYPQHLDRFKSAADLILENIEWLRPAAQKLLDEKDAGPLHPDVKAHWERLANY